MKSMTLFALCAFLALPAFAGQEAHMDWGGVKALYRPGSQLEAPSAPGIDLVGLLHAARERRPDLPVWNDRDLKALLEDGDLDGLIGLFIHPVELTRFGIYPAGFSFQLQTRYGCLEFSLPFGSDHWILDIC